MSNGLFAFRKIEIDQGFLDRIWRFKPSTLESLTAATVSQYSIALAQYLIFFRSEINKTKAEIVKKKKFLDSSISLSIDDSVKKKYKTKTAIYDFLINSVPELYKLEQEIASLQLEIIKLDGIDKSVSEYIATFKRELGRREQELFSIRAERRR